ncbi:PstC family ABC transporter permease [Chrysiogenes arsenatis]|uniref:PstC family ABC transporter permease n=1 Tax=Chrysiogenes arsenatis TaxID=309797 RepID=UPI00041A2B18|nr:ABC transporter permease subunit [Chrysiogenes arsenatis]
MNALRSTTSLCSVLLFPLGVLAAETPTPPFWTLASGSVLTCLLALVLAIPISLAIALLLSELLPPSRVRSAFIGLLGALAFVPGIVYGMVVVFIFKPFTRETSEVAALFLPEPVSLLGILFQEGLPELDIIVASLVLAAMVIPYMATTMREAFLKIDPQMREAAYALGATRTEVVRDVLLPSAQTGLIAGIVLAMGRALAEVMALFLLMGYLHEIPVSFFNASTSSSVLFLFATLLLFGSALLLYQVRRILAREGMLP